MIKKIKIVVPVFLTVLAILVSFTCLVTLSQDSGVFLYIGQQILKGKIHYRDVWDHKPPLIFYIDAFNLFLFGNSKLSLLPSLILTTIATTLLGYFMSVRFFGLYPAFFASILYLVTIIVGNTTEHYGLLLQFSVFYLLYKGLNHKGWNWYLFLAGITGGLAFCLKFHLVGLWLVIGFYLVITQKFSKQFWLNFLALLAGGLSVVLPIIIYYLLNNSFAQLIDAVVVYNAAYVKDTNRLYVLLAGVIYNSTGGLFLFSFLGWIFALLYLFSKKEKPSPDFSTLLFIILLDFPLEIILSIIPGATFRQYFIPWLPVMSLLAGFCLWYLIRALALKPTKKPYEIPLAYGLFSLALAIFALFGSTSSLDIILKLDIPENASKEVRTYIEQNSTPNDYLLLWGSGSHLNFLTNRLTPGRYLYFWPMYNSKYHPEITGEEFYQSVLKNKPKFIVDNYDWAGTDTPPLVKEKLPKWLAENNNIFPPTLQKLYDYVEANYELVGFFDNGRWPVYRYKNYSTQ